MINLNLTQAAGVVAEGKLSHIYDAMSKAAKKTAVKRAMTAYMAVLRKAAIKASPFDTWADKSMYRGSVKATQYGTARGTLASKAPGNVLEAGPTAEWWLAPLTPKPDVDGHMNPSLLSYLVAHGFPHLDQLQNGKHTAIRVKRDEFPARPWVIPSAEGAAPSARAAFERALVSELNRAVERA